MHDDPHEMLMMNNQLHHEAGNGSLRRAHVLPWRRRGAGGRKGGRKEWAPSPHPTLAQATE